MKRFLTLMLCFMMLILSCVFVIITDKVNTENNADEIVLIDGHLVEISEELNPYMADYASKLFNRIYAEQLKNNDCYFVLIPDKYKYLANKEGEYQDFFSYMSSALPFATPIEIYDLLSADDYYCTDMHWRQEKIIDIADRITASMDVECELEFNESATVSHFVGNYAHRCDIEVPDDDFVYLSNATIRNLEIAENIPVYDLKKLSTDAPYEMFLSGNQPIVTMKNDMAESDRRLVIFRDSFASSLTPLMCDGYSEIVLVDLRYIMSDMVPEYVDFSDADVLFMYSTAMINNSLSMK